jgi:NADH-quinone oxidoreductase subunit M
MNLLLAVEAAHGGDQSFPLLTVLVVLPAIAAVVVALVPRTRPELPRPIGVAAMVGTGALSVFALTEFDRHDAGFQFVSKHQWIESFGISWHLGIDGISLFLVVLTGLLFPLALLAVKPQHDPKAYTAWLLVLEAGCMGAFLSLDLFLFFVMFEVTLVPMYFLIGGWGYAERVYASLKFFLYTFLGSIFMLVAMVALVVLYQRGTGAETLTFDVLELANRPDGAIATETARWLFLGFAVAFAVKTPLFPFHTWLPDAHTQAPTAGSVILAGVLLKLGTYGFLRYGLYLFPEPSAYFAPVLVTLGVIGILYGAVVATMQKDLKRLVAYSSVAHLGFIVLGTFAFTTEALQGSVLQMVNHGVSTGALFVLVGMISDRRHTREIAALRGLQKAAPVMAGFFTVVMLSSIGLPGLNGFVGEFLILIGSFPTRRWWAVAAAFGVILAALYLLWAYQRVFHGTPDEENASTPDLTWREGLILVPFVVGIVFLGVYPKPVLERMEPAIDRLVQHVDEGAPQFEAPAPSQAVPSAEEGGH